MNSRRSTDLVDALRRLAQECPDELALVVHTAREDRQFTYRLLDLRARALASHLQSRFVPGAPALLLLDNDEHYVTAFFASLYAGLIAVPAFPPQRRQNGRLEAIADNCEACCALVHSSNTQAIGALPHIAVDTIDPEDARHWKECGPRPEDIAVLQYTSGSTSTPKGVMLSHANFLANERVMEEAMPAKAGDVLVSWLPLYHDMGLIGGLLQAIHRHIPLILMSPKFFLERPVRWLEAMSRFRGTISGGPDFAYRLCCENIRSEALAPLDLSSWRIACSGAEPVRHDTLLAFLERFSRFGFSPNALYPSYGLAESVLMVTCGGRDASMLAERFSTDALARTEVATDARGKALIGCGFCASDHEIRIVDPERLTEVPDGHAGEIWTRGPSVAQGYWRNEQACRETFVDWQDGRWLRTGDLGFLYRGELFVAGRRKDIIIIRGQNIYPQDVEFAVETDVKIVRSGRVAAFAVEIDSREGIGVAAEIGQSAQKAHLPHVLAAAINEAVANAFQEKPLVVALLNPGAMPKTSSGKLQRSACRTGIFARTLDCYYIEGLDDGRSSEPSAENTLTDAERVFGELWAEVLGCASLRSDANFFMLGGNSIAAVRMMARISELFGVELELREIFETPNLKAFADKVTRAVAETKTVAPTIPHQAERDRPFDLSPAQRGLWLTWRLDPESPMYNLPGVLHLRGKLDHKALNFALVAFVTRHEILRTLFQPDPTGKPRQVIRSAESVIFAAIDLRDQDETARRAELDRFAARPFALDAEPAFRAALYRLGENEHWLALSLHHIAADAWSLQILLAELTELYDAFAKGETPRLAKLPIQFADYATWQNSRFDAGEAERQLSYWRRKLGDDHPVLELPQDRKRQIGRSGGEARYPIHLPPPLNIRLHELARDHNSTLFIVVLALLKLTLYRYSGQTDLRVGAPIADRQRPETQGLIGYLTNLQVLRTQLDPRKSFEDLLFQLRNTVVEAQTYKAMPFDQLVEALQPVRQPGLHPLFQVKCTELPAIDMSRSLSALELRLELLSGGLAHFDLSFDFCDRDGSIEAEIAYAADLFDEATIAGFTETFCGLADQAARNPGSPLAALTLPTAPATLTGKDQPFAAQDILSLWDLHVARAGETAAVCDGKQSCTYAKLDARAEDLAGNLVVRGIGPDTAVGLYAPRSADFVIGMLAILKAGGAYVPLDPQLPAERLKDQYADSGAKLLMGTERPSWALGLPFLALASEGAGSPARRLNRRPHPAQAAYIVYTSGSTGRPKGVVISHGALANYVQGVLATIDCNEADRFAMVSTVAADLGHTMLFGALAFGRTLHLVPEDCAADADRFAAYMSDANIDVLKIVPSHLQALLQAENPYTVLPSRCLILGGEAAPSSLIERIHALRPDCRIFNHYGPTETTVGVLTQNIGLDARSDTRVALGYPLPNTYVCVLDAECNRVPQGSAGELYIGGSGLARGYIGRPGQTAERFIADPDGNGERLYRSGDRVRQHIDGRIEFLGRIDQQVKIRGYRVEPDEVSGILRMQAGVAEAVTVASNHEDGRVELHAYVVMQPGHGFEAENLRANLSKTLPSYMLPNAFVELPSLPLNANGKLDRKALPTPEINKERSYLAPQGAVEEKLASIWADVLGLDRIGRTDSFFELGGDSILSLKIIARARREGLRFTPKHLFSKPTISELATVLEAPQLEHEIPKLVRNAEEPLSHAQSRLWFMWQLEPQSCAYNMPGALHLKGHLDRAALTHAFEAIIARHEILRTTFHQGVTDEAVQRVNPPYAFSLAEVDASAVPAGVRERLVADIALNEAQTPFELGMGPLLRARLVSLSEKEHVLFVTMHHIVSDGWSMNLLAEEFALHYRAQSLGHSAAVPALPIQYADYAIWQRRRLQMDETARQLAYWKKVLGYSHPMLELPTDHARPAVQTYVGADVELDIGVDVLRELRTLAATYQVSLFMVLLAAFHVLLHRWSGQAEIRVGTPIANRNHPELEKLIGFFVNAQVSSIVVDGDNSFLDVLMLVKNATLEAQAHQDLPFDLLVEELNPQRSLSYHPLFQVTHNHRRRDFTAFKHVPDLEIAECHTKTVITQFDLTLNSIEFTDSDGLHVSFTYATALFERPTIERMAQQFHCLLQSIVATPNHRITRLPLVVPEAKEPARKADAIQTCVHALVERQADITPDSVALIEGEHRLTYGELDRCANKLARRLQGLGVAADTLVAVSLGRSFDLVVSLLAVLKAGGAYVPMDARYPRERLLHMLSESGVRLLITERKIRDMLALPDGLRVLVLDAGEAGYETEAETPLGLAIHPESLAYCIYTSGSTGRPKAVQVSHAALLNHMQWMQGTFSFEAGDRILQRTSFSFDASVWEFWLPFLIGGTCVLAPADADDDIDLLWSELVHRRVSVLQLVPSVLRLLLERPDAADLLKPVRLLFCGGEILAPQRAADLAKVWQGKLVNLYGPTETTIDASYWLCSLEKGERSIPIGHPIAQTALHVLDDRLEPVPAGVVGELYIGGRGLARGYRGQPGLTAERFIGDPFGGESGGRLYRTGDLVRRRADGAIEYIGRADQQIKLRGYRIELGEIEARLRETGFVKEAAVIVHEASADDKNIVVYIVADKEILKTRWQKEGMLSEWESVFENVYDGDHESDEPDFRGWVSSYTNEPIPLSEMREWLDTTVERIIEAKPQRVFEIGCGSGLILARLAAQCEVYVGTDFSRHAIERLGARLRGREGFHHVTLEQREAISFEGLSASAFDTVILNSIVQYFPNVDYLRAVLTGAASCLTAGGKIFIGDIRDFGRSRLFHTSVQLSQAPLGLEADELEHAIDQAMVRDKELLLAPSFFRSLIGELAHLTDVEIDLKKDENDNELTRYRYDVVLHFNGAGSVRFECELVWGIDLATQAELSKWLDRRLGALRIAGIPDRLLAGDLEARRLLHAERVGPGSLRELMGAFSFEGEKRETFRASGKARGYKVRLEPSAQSAGCFDAVFISQNAELIPAQSEKRIEGGAFANDPLTARWLLDLPGRLHKALQAVLPGYMLPSQIILVERMPLMPNGKLDRKALIAPDAKGKRKYEAPLGPIEESLAALWSDVLGVAAVGREDNFFQLGGHSLAATRLISRIRHGWFEGRAIDLPLRAVFSDPILRAQAGLIASELVVSIKPAAPIVPASEGWGGRSPLSPMQRRLWLIDRLGAADAAYNMTTVLQLDGKLSVPLLQETFMRLLDRHEALRTAFIESEAGDPVAEIRPSIGFELAQRDLSDFDDQSRKIEADIAIREHRRLRFDLTQTPLFHAALLVLDENRHLLLLATHHIAADGWSVTILVREFVKIYSALQDGRKPALRRLPLRYADYAAWHKHMLDADHLQTEAAFWRQYLSGAPTQPKLTGDYERMDVAQHEGGAVRLRVSADLRKCVTAFAVQNETTPFVVLLASFLLILHQKAGDDLLVGTDVAGRNHPDFENIVGFFVNLLPLRSRLKRGARFADFVTQTKHSTLSAFEHQNLPFDELIDLLDIKRDRRWNPLVQILFVLQNTPQSRFEIPGLSVEALADNEKNSKFDMALFISEAEAEYQAEWVYARRLFKPETVERMMSEWERLLSKALSTPSIAIDELILDAMMSSSEKRIDKLERLKAIGKDAHKPVAQRPLVRTSPFGNGAIPLMLQPAVPDLDPCAWVRENRQFIDEKLGRHAALLFRGFGLATPQEFETLAEAIEPTLYGCYGDLPKKEGGRRTYQSTPYPEQQMILYHNESSHLSSWPQKQMFYCELPAFRGGATPIVDCREIYRRLPPSIIDTLERKKLLYVRTFTERFDVSWREFFKTENREDVEAKLRSSGIDFRWLAQDVLQTRTLCPAIITHPNTSESVFFNQVQLHHIACLDATVRKDLLAMYGLEGMPRHVYYGDGSPIEDEVMELIGQLYEECAVRFDWQQGDVLMLDNMLAAHARDPYEGQRRIVVAMGAMFERSRLTMPPGDRAREARNDG